MSSRYTSLYAVVLCLFMGADSHAQSDQYKRKSKPAAKAKAGKAAPKAKKTDKVDISDLEQKYWAPKDTDFSVVQNRTYSKGGKYSFSAMMGPNINDPFNGGYNYGFKGNYYFSERYGLELTYIDSDLKDSDATKAFKKFAGGSVRPDFNREDTYIGLGFNWVPFYAKVSLLGKKIIYFDMQITPHVGMSTYEQQSDASNNRNIESGFSYGIDITQYFFLHQNFALRFDLHNRWYDHEVLAYQGGAVQRSEQQHTSQFLFGLTYFH